MFICLELDCVIGGNRPDGWKDLMCGSGIQIYNKSIRKGIIQIPYNPTLFDKEVEIIIVPKSEPAKGKMKVTEFVEKWAGFLSNNNTGNSMFNYLIDKYK